MMNSRDDLKCFLYASVLHILILLLDSGIDYLIKTEKKDTRKVRYDLSRYSLAGLAYHAIEETSEDLALQKL